MKILKQLSKNIFYMSVFYLLAFTNTMGENEPVDIWDLKNIKENEYKINGSDNPLNKELLNNSQLEIFKINSEKKIEEIKLDEIIESSEVKIVGLYDPEDYGLEIDMWSNTDGDQLKNIFSNLNKMNLSEDATEIIDISILTNAFYPTKNITKKEFLKIKSNWLIKNSDLEIIKQYLVKNKIVDSEYELTRYLIDQYLAESDVDSACEIFSLTNEPINDEYLTKFKIYCLVHEEKNNEAQLIFDLKKESGFNDIYFERKINFLFGFTNKNDQKISEDSILHFHLAHITDPGFIFEPNKSTDKLIWKYLSASNLLFNVQEIEITELEKISIVEKATHEKNYPEDDLFELYKRFQFNINQLLNAKNVYKSLTNIEGRALVYQKILIESDLNKKIELIRLLKDLFIKENIANAFDKELKKILKLIDESEVPSNHTTFYDFYVKEDKNLNKKIKYNNDILHQSKLISYFNGDYSRTKIEKDINNFLRKIKKDKKYYLSKKDIIFLESLKSDGIKISKKYDDLYIVDDSEIPTDIQVMINNNEMGVALLRIAEVIGQDKIDIIDEDTMYFIIATLNQLNIDLIRNRILLKVLPLKV